MRTHRDDCARRGVGGHPGLRSEGADQLGIAGTQRGQAKSDQARTHQLDLADSLGMDPRRLEVLLRLGQAALQQEQPADVVGRVTDVLVIASLRRRQALAHALDVGVLHPEAVLHHPGQRGELVKAVRPGRDLPGLHRGPGRPQHRQGKLRLAAQDMQPGPAVHHELEPLVGAGVVLRARIRLEQSAGGGVGPGGGIEALIRHLQPAQARQQVGPLHTVRVIRQAQCFLECLARLAAPRGSPQHVRQLRLQPDCGAGGPAGAGLQASHHAERRRQRRDRLVIGEGLGRVVAGHSRYRSAGSASPAAAKCAPSTAATSSSRSCDAASSAQAARPCSIRRSARSSPEQIASWISACRNRRTCSGRRSTCCSRSRAHSSATAGPTVSAAGHTAASSESGNCAPSTDAMRTTSRAVRLSRSTRDRTRRSSTCGTCRPSVLAIRQPPWLLHQHPCLQQPGQPFLQEQRVAFGAGQHGVDDLLAGRTADRDLASARSCPPQRAELYPADRRGRCEGALEGSQVGSAVRPAECKYQQRPVSGQAADLGAEAQ